MAGGQAGRVAVVCACGGGRWSLASGRGCGSALGCWWGVGDTTQSPAEASECDMAGEDEAASSSIFAAASSDAAPADTWRTGSK